MHRMETTDQWTRDQAGAAGGSGEELVKIPISVPGVSAEACGLDEARIRRLATEAPRVIGRLDPVASASQEAKELVEVLALLKWTSVSGDGGCGAQ